MSKRKSNKVINKGIIIFLVLYFLFKIGVALGVFNTDWERVLGIIFALFIVYIFVVQTIEDFKS